MRDITQLLAACLHCLPANTGIAATFTLRMQGCACGRHAFNTCKFTGSQRTSTKMPKQNYCFKPLQVGSLVHYEGGRGEGYADCVQASRNGAAPCLSVLPP